MRPRRSSLQRYRDAFLQRDLVWELEGLAGRAWPPPLQVDLDGWSMRAGRGMGAVVNCVWPGGGGQRLALPRKLETVERFYAIRRRPASYRLSPLASPPGLERALAERGYAATPAVSVRVAPLERLAPAASADDPPDLDHEPSRRWLDAWARLTGHGRDSVDVAAWVFARVRAPSAYAVVDGGRGRVTVARGVVDGGWLGIFNLTSDTGSGIRAQAAVIGALARWAAGHGGERAYLATRAPAAAGVSGFRDVYRYHYRVGR